MCVYMYMHIYMGAVAQLIQQLLCTNRKSKNAVIIQFESSSYYPTRLGGSTGLQYILTPSSYLPFPFCRGNLALRKTGVLGA